MKTIRAIKQKNVVGNLAFGSILLLFACSTEQQPANVDLTAPRAARSTSDVIVSAAKPDSATQDTTLDVTISGSGFTSDMIATWSRAGVADPAQVRTNSTRFVSSRTVIANITISATATTGQWDIELNSKSKGGIGTELFNVKLRGNYDTDSRALLVWDDNVNVAAPGDPVNLQPAGVVGDGRNEFGASGSTSRYQGAFCGVAAKIFWYNTSMSQSGDMTFGANSDYDTQHSCGASRTLYFYMSYQPGGARGTASAAGSFTNVRAVMQLAPGQAVSQNGGFGGLGFSGCTKIFFDRTTYPTAANIRVTRLADVNGARQWRVESEYPHLGMCAVAQGQKWIAKGTRYLPFSYTATEVRSPYPSYP
jgi:hypothetical protein